MVRRVLQRGNIGLMLLGVGHDLSGLVPPNCESIRVWPVGHPDERTEK